MKKFTLIIIVACLTISGFSQDWRYSNVLMGTENVSVIKSINDISNNTIVFGYYTGTLQPSGLGDITSRGITDYFIAKFDSLKNLLWVNSLGSSGFEPILGGAIAGPDKSIYVTGGFQGDFYFTDTDFITSTGNHDVFLAKFDENGNNVWCHNVGSGARIQRATTLNIDKQGALLLGAFYQDSINIGGDTTLYTNEFKDYMYGKFDSGTGDLIWAKALESIDSNFSGFTYSFAPAEDHYIISGVFSDSVQVENDTIVSESVNYYDVHILKTDLNGDVQWIRKVQGNVHDYSYNSTLDPSNNIYITGYFASTTGLIFDSTETITTTHNEKYGGYDFFIAKYSTEGILQWVRINGGSAEDRLLNSNFIDGRLWVTGYFADEMTWGAQTLTTDGPTDVDMFYGSIDPEGNYTGATQYFGRNNSREEGLSVFGDTTSLNAVLRTNSDIFTAGDSTYINPSKLFYVVVGNVGCLPIIVDEDLEQHIDVLGCFGDSTGQIGLDASGGFGDFTYSIGDDYPFQPSPVFNDLPAGSYLLEAKDGKNCRGTGPTVIINQPEELIVNSVDSTDVLCFGESTGTISVDAEKGTGTITYSVNGGVTYPFIAGTDVANVAAGMYEIAVKDANNCVKMPGTATILEPAEALTITLEATTDVTCNGVANGTIEVSAAGGTAPYEFAADGTTYQGETTFSGLSGGIFTPAVRDANDCVTTLDTDVTVIEPEALEITIDDVVDVTPDAPGHIFVSVSGGNEPYTYTISPDGVETGTPEQFEITLAMVNADAEYTVTVTDANSCETSTDPITVLDVQEGMYQLNASIYPNPSSGIITVEFNTEKAEMTMEVFSIDGRNVLSRQVYSAGGQVKETLDLSSLDKGMYMIRVDKQTLSSAVVLN